MAIRPDKKPRWATVPTVDPTTGKDNVIEPSEGKKDLGWGPYLDKITRGALNWVHNKAYEWIDYFDKNIQFLVIENEPNPDLSFKLQGGSYFSGGVTLITIADATLGPLTAPSADPRIDRVILNKLTATISILTGSEAASPTAPSLSTNEIALSQILLYVGQTQVLNADITDERPLWDTTLEASLTVKGVSELSTDAEAIAKADTGRALTPSNLAALNSSETFSGLSERATQSEVDTGTDDVRYVTPLKLKNNQSFRGCLVYLDAVQSIPNIAATVINFDQESYDTDDIHDNSTNNSRLTVPSDVAFVKIHSSGVFSFDATGDRRVEISKNGSISYEGHPADSRKATSVAAEPSRALVSTPILPVTGGNYFELSVTQSSGGALDCQGFASGNATWFAMEIIK